MQGVEFLASEQIVIKSIFNWKLTCIVGGIACLVVLLMLQSYDYKKHKFATFYINLIASLVVGLIVGSITGVGWCIPVSYTTEHKVTISDEVPMSMFLEKYEIVSQEGKILTIRELK